MIARYYDYFPAEDPEPKKDEAKAKPTPEAEHGAHIPRQGPTPRTDALFNWLCVRDEEPWNGADVEALLNHAMDLECELSAVSLRLSCTRTILAGTDAGSLPNDFPTDGMAAERMKELLNARKELESLATGCRNDGCYALRPAECAPTTTCEHGKGLTDYCQPCGRINNA